MPPTEPKQTFTSIDHYGFQQSREMQHDAMTVYGFTFLLIIFALVSVWCIVMAGDRVSRRYSYRDWERKQNIGKSCDKEIARLKAAGQMK